MRVTFNNVYNTAVSVAIGSCMSISYVWSIGLII